MREGDRGQLTNHVRQVCACLLIAGASLCGTASTATAAYPGLNGPIAYSAPGVDDELDIYVIDRDGGEPVNVTESEGSESNPAWSPEGRIVVEYRPPGSTGQSDIYVYDALGQEPPIEVTDDPQEDLNPLWWPFFGGLGWEREVSEGDHDIVHAAAEEGATVEPKIDGPGIQGDPAVDLGGEGVAYVETIEGDSDVMYFHLEFPEDGPSPLGETPADEEAPSWTSPLVIHPDGTATQKPEGSEIVFARSDGDDSDILVTTRAGSVDELVATPAFETAPDPSPDGTELVYQLGDPEAAGSGIFSTPLDAAGPLEIAEVVDSPAPELAPAWRPIPVDAKGPPAGVLQPDDPPTIGGPAYPAPLFRAPICRGEPATVVAGGRRVLRGTRRPDVIVGSKRSEKILARAGDDLVCAGGGADRVIGGRGDDILLGQRGADRLFGGPGRDLLRGGPGRDRVRQ